ncbi:MAG: type IV pilin protein [Janthinobacterium lividum]
MADSNVPEQRGEAGFTLIELMIVVTIIGILAAVAIPRYITYMRSSQTAEVGNIGGLMVSAMQSYADAQSLASGTVVTMFNGTYLVPAGGTAPSGGTALSNVLPQLTLPGNASFTYTVSAIAATAGPQSGDVAYCILAAPASGASVMYSSSPISPTGTAAKNGWTGRVFNQSYVNGAASLTGVAGGYCSATGAAQASYS